VNYNNASIKIDQLVSYLNEEKINLSPAFQRGHVWNVSLRRKLLKNIVLGKPIPAIFLYKEASGTRYSYNILDGKQRLESVILFIGNKHPDLRINNWQKYFFGDRSKKDAHFSVELLEGERTFNELEDNVVRDFREYAIPTIEISLDDATSLDEVITLFVDINQYGVAVNRFDIVKAMCKDDPLIKSIFALLAERQRRQQDIFYRMKRNDITAVLKRLQLIENIHGDNSKVDRMWERLLEIALFFRSGKHRKPVEILKGFISPSATPPERISAAESKKIRRVFQFLNKSYHKTSLGDSRLAADQTHFYTMITSIHEGDLLGTHQPEDLAKRLATFGELIEAPKPPRGMRKPWQKVREYLELSTKQTTDVSRRTVRGSRFLEIIASL
jgi:hypothetical protein